MRRSLGYWNVKGGLTTHRDTDKSPRMIKEVGTWLYTKDTMQQFQAWCREHQVRAYGNVKMTTTIHFARCLRASRHVAPGQAIVTCPWSACFNFLTVAKAMYDAQNCIFPLQLNWMNYDERLSFLRSTSVSELATAGWMVRIASLGESSFAPYIKYLLEDTRGRDGIANGISKEREEESGLLDHYFSEMATDACEDPEVFLEQLFRSFACLHLRTQPIEPNAIECYMSGTNFFKAKSHDMYVPTLMPLIDAVPQLEDGTHNTVVEYFPFTDVATLEKQCKELGLSFFSRGQTPIVSEETRTPEGLVQRINEEHQLMDIQLLRGGGFFALRALQPLEEGDVLYTRAYPRLGDAEKERMNAQVLEANRLMSHEA